MRMIGELMDRCYNIKMTTIDYIRIALTIVILTFVWLNAHWSVALTLTLITIAIEIAADNKRNTGKY